MVCIHLGLMLEESNGVVDVVNFHFQGGVFIHTADTAGGLEAAIIKTHADKAAGGHLAGEHGGIHLIDSRPTGIGNDTRSFFPLFVIIGKIDVTHHLCSFTVKSNFALFHFFACSFRSFQIRHLSRSSFWDSISISLKKE